MNIALAQLDYHIGNFEDNSRKIIDTIERLKKQNIDLVIFSELSVCGYSPLDLLEQHDFLERSDNALHKIAKHCVDIAAIVGAPVINKNIKGKKLYNAACFLYNGEVKEERYKSLLPTYDIFDEYRYFEPNKEYSIIEYKSEKIALTICEDLWDKQPSAYRSAKGELYDKSPMTELIKQNPDYIINIAASPFSYNQGDIRTEVLVENAKKYKLPVLYVNQIGGNTELIFDGDSMVINSNGDIVKRLDTFKEGVCIVDTNELLKNRLALIESEKKTDYIEQIYNALVLGVKDYLKKMNFKSLTLGLSGGIDSAVTLAIVADAIGSENIRVLLLPSKYSSEHSVKDAEDLAKNLNVEYDIINIQPIVDSFETGLSDIFTGLSEDVTEENIQARVRGVLMMALSNKFGNMLLNTSNKSEAAVGYSTMYGDMNGGLSVLGDVYKTDIFKLAQFINREREIIPINTIVKPPSAELRPNQKDSDSLPEYNVLDAILFEYIEQKLSSSEIISKGFDEEIVIKVLRLVDMNEYKRFQTPPILRVSSKAFGFGRRMPLVAKY